MTNASIFMFLFAFRNFRFSTSKSATHVFFIRSMWFPLAQQQQQHTGEGLRERGGRSERLQVLRFRKEESHGAGEPRHAGPTGIYVSMVVPLGVMWEHRNPQDVM